MAGDILATGYRPSWPTGSRMLHSIAGRTPAATHWQDASVTHPFDGLSLAIVTNGVLLPVRILIVSQVYWPDMAAVSQILTDLAEALVAGGHEVTVLSGRRRYDNAAEVFPASEGRRGVKIRRLPMTGFGKGSLPGRLCDFATFNLALVWRLAMERRDAFDVVLGLTSPPLVSFIGVLAARLNRWRFCYWTMDLQPELAIEAGLIRRNSLAARALDAMGTAVFRRSDRIVALDHFMADYIRLRGAPADTVCVGRLWPVVEDVWNGARLENPFRLSHGFGDRFVVMYSGNHAVVHPLDTLLEAARLVREDDRFLFVFIGGGVRMADVTAFRERHALTNIVQLPYQPRKVIHQSLAAADLHVVVMGDGQVGFTHPNKVYGAMFIGRPFLYIGPSPSHVTDLLADCQGNLSASHGDAAGVERCVRDFHSAGPAHREEVGRRNAEYARTHFVPAALIRRMCDLVTGTGVNA